MGIGLIRFIVIRWSCSYLKGDNVRPNINGMATSHTRRWGKVTKDAEKVTLCCCAVSPHAILRGTIDKDCAEDLERHGQIIGSVRRSQWGLSSLVACTRQALNVQYLTREDT